MIRTERELVKKIKLSFYALFIADTMFLSRILFFFGALLISAAAPEPNNRHIIRSLVSPYHEKITKGN